jgi:hypothetical protein
MPTIETQGETRYVPWGVWERLRRMEATPMEPSRVARAQRESNRIDYRHGLTESCPAPMSELSDRTGWVEELHIPAPNYEYVQCRIQEKKGRKKENIKKRFIVKGMKRVTNE